MLLTNIATRHLPLASNSVSCEARGPISWLKSALIVTSEYEVIYSGHDHDSTAEKRHGKDRRRMKQKSIVSWESAMGFLLYQTGRDELVAHWSLSHKVNIVEKEKFCPFLT